MPMDVYAAVGALVRAEITRAHASSTDTPAIKAATHTNQVAPSASAPSPTKAARRSRKLLVLALRRLATLFG
ncbi:hypothetical protein ACFYTG_39575 [Streptomyces mirabilis]|uniref:hypothetical protein n=1 Tax=Streptomyces mirabilis TaxID=68239 RepID=UPI0036919758